jgi:hypothetical protein
MLEMTPVNSKLRIKVSRISKMVAMAGAVMGSRIGKSKAVNLDLLPTRSG